MGALRGYLSKLHLTPFCFWPNVGYGRHSCGTELHLEWTEGLSQVFSEGLRCIRVIYCGKELLQKALSFFP